MNILEEAGESDSDSREYNLNTVSRHLSSFSITFLYDEKEKREKIAMQLGLAVYQAARSPSKYSLQAAMSSPSSRLQAFIVINSGCVGSS